MAICFTATSWAAESAPVVDDFSSAGATSRGVPRFFITDTSAGGQTTQAPTVAEGVLTVKGEISPARGQPGWASAALPLAPQGQPFDASDFEGIRLRVRINKGNLSVSANSAEVTNFDFHAAIISPASGGDFQDVKIPFDSMKRAWSEQTPLNPATLTGISLVAYDVRPAEFEYEVDEVGFY
ncbi:hypothetical protein F3N42_00900 [Marinihelvus fidelis]|uniref:NADH:ubiquinone oxidoreductase intermediate-associated protein 30 domain-containing protein n=2 Tax=Marinihelvus fidelis TaxID=2613842 RepID=A0A5N0TIH8_9GAMM|nr:hypothetical protein F3N42_00900 [Marinihelvus fidelis]